MVTILFCDVSGSTSYAELLDPEEWAEIMNQAFHRLIEPVERYGGTVARLMGDSILAFFGAPVAHEDDPQRAILAGLEILANVGRFRQQLPISSAQEFNVRVGVNTGLVVVGDVGLGLSMEYTAMGDAVNLAARMEQSAAPGTLQIAEDTYQLVAPLFEVVSLGALEIKGKRQPVMAYRVLGLKATPGRLRGIAGLDAPLVGRAAEMAALKSALTRLADGFGQIVCLIGEAGLGKSRLIRELHAWVEEAVPQPQATRTFYWHASQNSSYSTGQPYGAFQQMIRGLCGIAPTDTPDQVRIKLGCECLSPGAPPDLCQRVSRSMEIMLGLASQEEQASLEGEAFQRELMESLTTIWRDWTRRAPTVVVFDDLHWADPASVELLLHLFPLVEQAPLLFLLAFRHDREASSWQIKEIAERDYLHRYTQINLLPLSSSESNALVNHLLAVSDLPVDLRQMVLQKTDGNPFFVEEVVRSLIENGVVVREAGNNSHPSRWRAMKTGAQISLPDNVQSLLIARVDRLEEPVRHVLQLAAVIGRSFSRLALEQVLELQARQPGADQGVIAPLNGNLERALQTLQGAGLIQSNPNSPGRQYLFRHALAQEAVYNAILHKRRRFFHRLVAESLEKQADGHLDDLAPELAQHFHAAQDQRALTYARIAGDTAFRLYANVEATEHYSRALEWAVRTPQSDLLAHLYLGRGRALERLSRFAQADANYLEMENLASSRDDQALLLKALIALGTLHSAPTRISDPEKAREFSLEALGLARQLGDRQAEVNVLWNLTLHSVRMGRSKDAVLYGEQGLALARAMDLPALLASILNDVSQAYVEDGQLQLSKTSLEEASRIFRELGIREMLADTLGTHALIDFLAGHFDQALQSSAEALEISNEIDNIWGQSYSRMYVGYIYIERGELGKAIEEMETCIQLAEKANFLPPQALTRAQLGELYVELGAVEQGEKLMEEALAASAPFPVEYSNLIKISLAHAALLKGDISQSKRYLQELECRFDETNPLGVSISLFKLALAKSALASQDYAQLLQLTQQLLESRAEGVKAYETRVLYLQGLGYLYSGQLEAAVRDLQEARRLAEANGLKRNLWRILAAQAEIESRSGNPQEAASLRARAAAILHVIADSLPNEDLRALFLRRPEVLDLVLEM